VRAVNLHVSGKLVTPAESLLAAGVWAGVGFLPCVSTNVASLLRGQSLLLFRNDLATEPGSRAWLERFLLEPHA
jgi:hypothetical protein